MNTQTPLYPVPLISLPSTVVTLNGGKFDPRDDVWSYLDGPTTVYIDFRTLSMLSEDVRLSLKHVMVWYLQNRAPRTCTTKFDSLRRLFRTISSAPSSIYSISIEDLVKARVYLKKSDGDGAAIIESKPVLKRWAELGYTGVSESALKYLNEIKLKGDNAGTALATFDSSSGPYTDIERETLLDALCQGFREGMMTLQQYVLAWLAALFGQRPIQYALLKLRDLEVLEDERGRQYILNIPLAKSTRERQRTSFNRLELIPEFGTVLMHYSERIAQEFKFILDDVQNAPFFPSNSKRRDMNTSELPYHMSSVTITDELRRAFAKLNVFSERTGKKINVNAYRFRYTVGTNCMRDGLGPAVTAKRLGHRTLKSIQPYVDVDRMFELHDRIDLATAKQLGTLCQAFKGTLVRREKSKIDGKSHIVSQVADEDFSEIGDCGSNSYCSLNRPVACYTCALFRPWLDAPHSSVFSYLEQQRTNLFKKGCSDRIVSLYDRTIIAVAQVIAECDALLKNETEGRANA
jgi:integrase